MTAYTSWHVFNVVPILQFFWGFTDSKQTQATVDVLAALVCFTFEPAFFYTLTANSKKFCLVPKDYVTTYLLMTQDRFCSVLWAVTVKGSRVPITILCIQSDSCRKTALQRFAEFLNELTRQQHCLLWRHLPITASCLGTNQSPSLCSWEKWTVLLSQIFCGWMASFRMWFCSSNHSVLLFFFKSKVATERSPKCLELCT